MTKIVDSNWNWRSLGGFVVLFLPVFIGYLMSGHCVTTYEYTPVSAPPPVNTKDYSRSDVYHEVQKDAVIHGWFYSSKHKQRAPLVVISHGLGSQKDMGLEAYAIAFARAGASIFDLLTH